MTRDEKLEMQYVGVLNFVCENAVYLNDDHGQNEIIGEMLSDAQEVLPNLQWKQIINRFEMWFVPDQPTGAALP